MGPLLGSALIFLTSLRVAFLLTFLIVVLTLAVNTIPSLRHNDPVGRISTSKNDPDSPSELMTQITNGRGVGANFYITSCALAAVSSGVLFTFFAPYARSLGISILLIGVVTFVYGFGRFVFYILTTNERIRHSLLRSDKRVRSMIIALVMTSLSSLLISLRDPSGVAYIIAYGIVGVGISIVFAISQAGIIAESSPEKLGRNAGIFESSIGVGACAGPIIGGAISGSSLAVPFIVPPLGFVAFLAVYPLIMRKKR